MSKIKVNNVDLDYEVQGTGKDVLLFSHGYLMNKTMYERQIDVLKDKVQCIAYDHRGHGKSEVTQDGYELDNLVTDAIKLIENLDLGPVHFVGMSTGGFVGLRLAIRRPDLLKSMVLMNTSAEGEEAKALRRNNVLLWVVKNIGWFPVVNQVMPILFHKTFRKDKSRRALFDTWKNIVTGTSIKSSFPFGKSIFYRKNILDKLSAIKIPTLVIAGEFDLATPAKYNKRIAENIPNASYVLISDVGHSAAIEKPKEVSDAMVGFYSRIGVLQ